MIHKGNCLEVVPTLGLFDAVVTDPPYGLGFMGKDWDHGVPGVPFWTVILAAMKPGAHLLAFGGTRTFHRLTCAIEDAGFEIRDCLGWLYGSGFPKSHDVSKAIDKAAGAERVEVRRHTQSATNPDIHAGGTTYGMDGPTKHRLKNEWRITATATPAAKQWQGWGTALKPAHEPIVLARKPLDGTVAENVLRHGTGGLNIDGCRVGTTVETWPKSRSGGGGYMVKHLGYKGDTERTGDAPAGRWPSNILHDGSEEVLAVFPESDSTKGEGKSADWFGGGTWHDGNTYGDKGSAARFFYCSKDRPALPLFGVEAEEVRNVHPTVKPVKLMRYLCRLVTPPGGRILDPFAGSGSTLVAAKAEGFQAVGVELDATACDMARVRLGLDPRPPQGV